MKLPLRKHPVITVTAVLIIALLAWGFWPQPVLIEAIAVKRAPLTVTIEEEGRTRVIDRYIISAAVDGVTCRLDLEVGDPVKQGQVLLEITPLESQGLDPRSRALARAQVAAAESALEAARGQATAAQASARLAATELGRLRPLLKGGAISQEAFDRAVTKAQTTTAAKRSADFNVEVARYELQATRTVLEYSADSNREAAERLQVRSPIIGKILKVVHECEGPVRTGEPLLEVGDPASL
ncbi:MAG: HlyD family secretion protein, partial [Deltaproteobacteria bacterium]|nr:HlyD family secretion protein [Deltaproteobacteria bacterium]